MLLQNIQREMFDELTEMVYAQNCMLIRKICDDKGWDADKMIKMLLDNDNSVIAEEHFNPEEESVVTKGIQKTKKEMEQFYSDSKEEFPIVNEMIGQSKKIEGLITLEESFTVNGKQVVINRMADISGILIMWKGHLSLWDISEGKIYNIIEGELTFCENCNKKPEEMIEFYIDV